MRAGHICRVSITCDHTVAQKFSEIVQDLGLEREEAQPITVGLFCVVFVIFGGFFHPILFAQNFPTKFSVAQKKSTFRKSAYM